MSDTEVLGVVDAGEGPLNGLYFNNDLGGTSQLPPGRYRIRLDRSFDDYETGVRCIGELVDDEAIEIATKTGTSGFASGDMPYRPTRVYFSARQFERST